MTSYRVLLAEEAAEDLLRIEDLTIERELASATPDLDVVRCLRDAVDRALRLLEFSPYSCRKAARALNDNQRELIVPFGNAGLVPHLKCVATLSESVPFAISSSKISTDPDRLRLWSVA